MRRRVASLISTLILTFLSLILIKSTLAQTQGGFNSVTYLFYVGDSKTAAKPWNDELVASLSTKTHRGWAYNNAGVVGATVPSTLIGISALLAASTNQPQSVLCNLGVNDFVQVIAGLETESNFESNYESIIDRIHAKWPETIFYLTYPWDSLSSNTVAPLIHTWINVVISARSSFVFLGDDEAIWYRGVDNGVSETIDGVHPSVLGNIEMAAQKQAILGF